MNLRADFPVYRVETILTILLVFLFRETRPLQIDW